MCIIPVLSNGHLIVFHLYFIRPYNVWPVCLIFKDSFVIQNKIFVFPRWLGG